MLLGRLHNVINLLYYWNAARISKYTSYMIQDVCTKHTGLSARRQVVAQQGKVLQSSSSSTQQ